MLTVGIDLSSQPERTAACVFSWAGETARLEQVLGPGVSDSALMVLCRQPGVVKVGIDAPFGWPVDFVEAVGEWAAHGRWSLPSTARPVYRETDRAVRARVALVPLAVTADRIAHAAFRCVELLTCLVPGEALDRLGGGLVAEVYPAAALRCWGLPYQGYKGADADAGSRRAAILEGLSARFPALPANDLRALVARSDHVLDAAICALIAREVAAARTQAIPDASRDIAAREGWIHLPST